MTWKLKYPDWYSNEISLLEKSPIYKEEFRCFKLNLVSCGYLLVRTKTFKKYPIFIFYPSITPYSPPKIFILNELLSEDEVKAISDGNNSKLSEILRNKKKLLYLRHQMSDGEVCFLEQDFLHSDVPQIFSINDILNRVTKWLISVETGKIPFDTVEVEFYSHFPSKTDELNILLPDTFYTPKLTSGEFYLCKYFTAQEMVKNNKTYMGVQIVGQSQSGISVEPIFDEMFSTIVNTKFPKSMDFILNEEALSKAIRNEEVIEGSWWDIDIEPQPFANAIGLLKLLNSDIEEAKNIFCTNKVLKNFSTQPALYFGFRFKNRRGILEWIIFKLKKKENAPFLLEPKVDEISDLLNNYLLQIIKTELFSDTRHHLRNDKRAKRDVLSNKVISILGCGALGSEIADSIGKAGVGEIFLFDNQFIQPNNPIRHLCGLDKLYYPKSLAVYMNLFEHNPFIKLSYNTNDILEENINNYVTSNGISISSIANDNIEAFINEQAITNDKIIFYSRVLRGGKVGRIFRVIPGKDACFRCLTLYKLENSKMFTDIPEDSSFKTILNECNNPIRPASASDIKLIASITARIIIDHLQADDSDFNHWIYTSESIDEIVVDPHNPYIVKASFLPPHPNCNLCSSQKKIKIRLLKRVKEFLIEQVNLSGAIETGGILIGFRGKNDFVYVARATGPGEKAVRRNNWFERDVEYCQKILNEEYDINKDKGLYVGEWHYHPNPSNKPSDRDLMSLSQIAEADNYLIEEPIMLIFSNEKKISASVHPINKKFYFTEIEILEKERNEI